MPNTIVLPSGSFPDSANRQHATNALKALQICEKGILEIPKDENASQTQPNILGAVVFYLINDDQSIYNITLGEFINNYSDFKYEYTFGSTKGMVFLDTDSHNYVTVAHRQGNSHLDYGPIKITSHGDDSFAYIKSIAAIEGVSTDFVNSFNTPDATKITLVDYNGVSIEYYFDCGVLHGTDSHFTAYTYDNEGKVHEGSANIIPYNIKNCLMNDIMNYHSPESTESWPSVLPSIETIV